MNKFITITVVVLISAIILFTIGYQTALHSTLVTVSIRNNSSFDIGAAQIEHAQGTVSAANIKRNHTSKVRFYSKGQNTYKLSILFNNNKSIYSEERTTKPGNTTKEIVTDSTIIVK